MKPEDLLSALIAGKSPSAEQSAGFIDAVLGGDVPPALCGAILAALRIKGETAEEAIGFIKVMRQHMIAVDAPGATDVVGSGGDGAGTFNISTTAALVVAGAGVPVAKHGNRAASSACGSADVLEALGVKIELSKEQAERVFTKAGIVFLFAPLFHPALKPLVAVRRELKIRTIFNVLGPFLNPAQTKRQLTGLPSLELARIMAQVAASLGYERNLIVVGDGGTDEITTSGPTQGFLIEGPVIKKMTIDPQTFGIKPPEQGALSGGDAKTNAHIVRDILAGKQGPRRDIVALNAGAALFAAGVAKDIKAGIARAEQSIDSGKAAAALARLTKASTSV